MLPIISYYKYNIKILAQDKLPLLWSIIVPSVFLYLNHQYVDTAMDLRFWWAYIIITSYIYGVGIYSMTMKESGTLKTLFSICRQPFLFFFGNLMTQITYCIVCIGVFNLGAVLYLKLPVIPVFLYSLIIIFLSVPVAFLGMLLTLFHKIHVNSLSSLVNIIMMIFFFTMNMNISIQKINPISYYANVITLNSGAKLLQYLIISAVSILLGSLCIVRFSVIPIEKR